MTGAPLYQHHDDEDPLSFPCGECRAEVGEPCRPWCTGLDWIPDQDDTDDHGSDADEAPDTAPAVTTT